jgi:hypothetical protein
MRKLLIVVAALSLGACVSTEQDRNDRRRPDTADAVGSTADARAQALQRCGPGADVSQRRGTTGTRANDWECARSSPR